MAWETKEEEVLDIVQCHLEVFSKDRREDFVKKYSDHLFFNHPPEISGIWRTNCTKITCVALWGTTLLLNNLKVAMIKEALGLGPQKYYIVHF